MDARSFSALLGLLPATLTGWSVSPGSFRAISVSEGESTHMTSFNVTTGLVASLSAILAAHQVSIFYVSTFETDFVVIKQSQMALAIRVLKEQFGEESVEVEEEEEAAEQGEGEPGEGEVEGQPSPSLADAAGSTSSAPSVAAVMDPNASVYLPCLTLSAQAAAIAASVAATNSSLSASSSSTALSGLKSTQVTSPLQLYALPQTFFLAHWREEEVCTHIRSLLQLFFFPLGKAASASSSSASKSPFPSDRFFSYSNIDSAVSMQVDAASLSLLQADYHLSMSFEKWRAFQVAGQFGFEECGIVAALSGPLTRASICPYYISSFFTDVCFVQEAKWEHARAILEKEFKFVEREIRPKAQTPAEALAAAGPASAAAARPHTGMHTSGAMHMPVPHSHHTAHQPMVFHTSTLVGAHPGQAVQSLALMRGISNTSNTSSGGHSTASPAHTRGPSNLHSPAPVDNYAPLGASDVSMPILSAGGVSHTSSHSSNRGSSPSPYDAMGSGDAFGGLSRPISMPARTTSTGSATADPSPYDPIGPAGAVSPGGGAHVPLLITHTSSYSTAMAEPSPYDAVHAAPTHVSPAQHAAPPHAVAAAPSPYAAIASTDIHSAPMHVVTHTAMAVAPSPAVVSSPAVVAAAPPAAAKSAGALSLFASAALVMPSSHAQPIAAAAPAPVAAAASSVPSSSATPFTVEALSAPVERLSCFRVSVDKVQAAQLLRLGEGAAPASAAAASLYSADPSSPAAAASSPSAADGLFLLRPCSDPSELLPTGLPNPHLWVLCYNKKGSMIKTKVYRINAAGAGAPPQWSLGLTGHRLFPSLHAIITAVVGPHAKPIA